MLLQIMEEGRLTDSFGRNIDFKNTVLIMTSNIGAERITSQGEFGFGKRDEEVSYNKMKTMLQGEVERHFRPEFINRVDELVVFHKLNHDNLSNIVDLEAAKVARRLADRGLTLELDPAAKDYLIENGTDDKYGARPLRRAIENKIEDPLSEAILRGEYEGKNRILVTVGEDEEGEEQLRFEGAVGEPAEEKPQEPVGAGNVSEET